ncbi:MAG: amino acid ABC transporter permease [Clostridia bacterium]|nr:amino acid ABC transporter permease [Clostridia bacterium]MBR6603556.1 amino acid ABC transporter permease [Clostridia bacterium]
MPDTLEEFNTIAQSLWGGFLTTLELFAMTLLFALPLGLIISFGSMSKFGPLKYITKVFVWIIRGTPLMLQIFIVFFIPGIVFNNPIFKQDRFLAALITFVINYACYFSEIYRGGIESISVGQYEAGQVLGMTKAQTFFHVVLLQVVKRILAPISNEVITLVKDTSLVRVISVIEIIKVAERFSSQGLLWPLFFTSIYYLVFNGLLTLLFGYIEKKLSYFRA